MLLLTVCWLIPLLTLVPTLYGRNGCMGFVTSFGIIAVSSCQCLPFRLNFLITIHSRLHKRTMSCTIIADSEVSYHINHNDNLQPMISWRKSLRFVHLSLTGQHAKADAVQRGLHHPLHYHAGYRRGHLFQGDLTALLIRLTYL